MKRPYIALGCTQSGRVTPTKLTAAHLDRRIAEKQETRGLGDLLLSSGAVEGPFKIAHPVTRWRMAFHRLIRTVCVAGWRP